MTPIALKSRRLLGDLMRQHGGLLDVALGERSITHLASPRLARAASELTLLVSARLVPYLSTSLSPVLVCPELAERVPAGRRWVHERPWWALAAILTEASPRWEELGGPRIAASASIAKSSVVAPGAVVGEHCCLEEGVVVYGGVELGERVVVGAGSVIGRPGFGYARGADGVPRRIPQLGGVVIADEVEIGALCSIDSGTLEPTTIGEYTKLDAQVHVGHNARLGKRCFLAAQVGLAGSVELGDDVWVGGQAGVADHVRIGDGARVAAKSGVIADVAAGTTVAGYPAVPRARWLRGMARLVGSRSRFAGSGRLRG